MKKVLFSIFILVFILNSCIKDNSEFIDKSKQITIENRENIANREVMNNLDVFSKAFSRGLILYDDLRYFIKSKSETEQGKETEQGNGFEELLLNCIKSEDIRKGTTFEEQLDSLIFYYSNGKSSSEVIKSILSVYPTISINIPDKFLNIDWDTDDLGKTPAVVYYEPDTIISFNGENIQTNYFNKEKTIYYLNLKISEKFLELDLTSGSINNGQLNINDFIAELSDNCKQKVKLYFNTIVEDCKNYDDKIIFDISELYKIMNSCDKIIYNNTFSDFTPPLCLTMPIRDVDDQHYTYNYWEGIEFQSVNAGANIDNQPGGEKYFTFVFIWANAKNGGTQSHKRYYQILKYHLYTEATYTWIPDISVCDDRDILSGNTDGCGYFELNDPGEIFHYSFSEGAGKYFFSLSDSRWYLNDIGKFFNLEIVEFDPVTTTTESGGGTISTHSMSFDFKVPLFEGVSFGGGYKESGSTKVSHSTSITGASIVPIGQDPIDWCDQESQFLDYPWGNLINVRVGCDVLEY